jgi:K+-transporting ATPase ATPase C chain
MKTNIFPALRLTIISLIFFSGIYTCIVWGFAQLAPNHGQGETVTVNGKVVGYALIGQKFTADKYFNSRPSAVNYNAASAGASNKGPGNPDYLAQVQASIDTFLKHNPEVKKEEIPSELVTASGSGLDPDISPAAAYVQIARISKVRGIGKKQVSELVTHNIQKPLLGLFGTARINVLKLNIELDKIK